MLSGGGSRFCQVPLVRSKWLLLATSIAGDHRRRRRFPDLGAASRPVGSARKQIRAATADCAAARSCSCRRICWNSALVAGVRPTYSLGADNWPLPLRLYVPLLPEA